jgi:SAM-dependent methyltransferase
MDEIAPDGSPVEVYLRIPAGQTVERIAAAIPPSGTVLDLGCGVGRIGAGLVEAGHEVTGVDNSPAMLMHARQRGLATVEAELSGLDLGRRYDVVLLLSHFVNEADDARRSSFWSAAGRHVLAGGHVLVERFAPEWVRTVEPMTNTAHGVAIELHDLSHDGDELHATITYRIDDRAWSQTFTVIAVDDELLAQHAAAHGLHVERSLDPDGELVLLRAR